MKKIITRTAEFTLLEEDIILSKMKNGVEVDVDDVKESIEATIKIARDKQYSSLIDARVQLSITKEGREFFARHNYPKPYARAILVNSLANKILANFMLQFDKSYLFAKVFTDERKAIEWLRKKREGHLLK